MSLVSIDLRQASTTGGGKDSTWEPQRPGLLLIPPGSWLMFQKGDRQREESSRLPDPAISEPEAPRNAQAHESVNTLFP
jgi:hypothetical protein